MSMDLFIARTITTKASLVFRGLCDITESQVNHQFTNCIESYIYIFLLASAVDPDP